MRVLALVVAAVAVLAAAAWWSVGRGTAALPATVRFASNPDKQASPQWTIGDLPPPSSADAAARAAFRIVSGRKDRNSSGVEVLNDGVAHPVREPASNFFFFDKHTQGGRLVCDLGARVSVRQINSYSWHDEARAAQVYKVYGSDGTGTAFNPAPAEGTDPAAAGWNLVAAVDTRTPGAKPGGQFAVSIGKRLGALGSYRYLLFDVSSTNPAHPYSNTFFAEIDVIGDADAGGPLPAPAAEPAIAPATAPAPATTPTAPDVSAEE